MKPKAQTLQQKLGFFDEDLKKPKHDEIMLWLNENIEDIINNLYNKNLNEEEMTLFKQREKIKIESIKTKLQNYIKSFKSDLNKTENDWLNIPRGLRRTKEELNRAIESHEKRLEIVSNFSFDDRIPLIPRITRIDKKWEHPITTSNGNSKYVIGFIDFAASFDIPVPELKGLKYEESETQKGYYYDIDENNFGFGFSRIPKIIYIEVKTEINSLGELLRQINHYKSYIYTSVDFYVLAPDDTYKGLLKEQGIGFIKYQQNNLAI